MRFVLQLPPTDGVGVIGRKRLGTYLKGKIFFGSNRDNSVVFSCYSVCFNEGP